VGAPVARPECAITARAGGPGISGDARAREVRARRPRAELALRGNDPVPSGPPRAGPGGEQLAALGLARLRSTKGMALGSAGADPGVAPVRETRRTVRAGCAGGLAREALAREADAVDRHRGCSVAVMRNDPMGRGHAGARCRMRKARNDPMRGVPHWTLPVGLALLEAEGSVGLLHPHPCRCATPPPGQARGQALVRSSRPKPAKGGRGEAECENPQRPHGGTAASAPGAECAKSATTP
jgi:hypothetical protein